MCAQGRPDETEYGARFFAGEVSDAYLQKRNIQRGYSVVIWRGRHVAEPTELSEEEAAQYWREVLEAGRRIEQRLQPVKLNYDILGNELPHLHTHVVPRYADDPKPNTIRLSFVTVPPERIAQGIAALAQALKAALVRARS